MWLLMKGTDNISPTVNDNPAHLVMTSTDNFGASVWTAAVTPEMVAAGGVTVTTWNPRQLNALILFEENDPPFDKSVLKDFVDATKTFTYILELPSVPTQTMHIILPVLDITYWTDDLLPDTRLTTVTTRFGDQPSQMVTVNEPNLGNGLLMTQFPFTIGPFSEVITSTKVVTVTVETEDSVYILGPRTCRPVYFENIVRLCSAQVGCVSDTVRHIPLPSSSTPNPISTVLYLPIIMKSSP
jgi:hypothetical protein